HWAIKRARKQRDREEAMRLMVDARKLLSQGMYEEAKTKAGRAQQLHGPYGAWEFGDRPANIIAEAERAAQNDRKKNGGRDPMAGASPTTGPKTKQPPQKQ